MRITIVRFFKIAGSLSVFGSSLALSSTPSRSNDLMTAASNTSIKPAHHYLLHSDRRKALTTALTSSIFLLTAFVAPNPAFSDSIASPPLPQEIITVILDSPNSKIGVQLYDVSIGSQAYPAVKSIVSDTGEAALQGVQIGMIILSYSSSKSVVQRISSGPYPVVLQFYNLAKETNSLTASEGLDASQSRATAVASVKEPHLSSKGTGLVTKTVQKGKDCTLQARRGDTVTISYEARVASPGGPIYDSSESDGPVTFVLGDGKAISGVDIGMGGMCEGEIRELDIPSALGYGRAGSRIFDIPGDVRLWWRVELLQLSQGGKKW